MLKYELYELNRQLQCQCRCTVDVLRYQNYYAGMQLMQHIHLGLEQFLSKAVLDTQVFDLDTQTMFMQSLQAVIQAQENSDYVLLADVLELQLLADLENIQNRIRNCIDFSNIETSLWNANVQSLSKKDDSLAEELKKIGKAIIDRSSNEELSVWIEPTNSGSQTLVTKDDKGIYYFHSNNDPFYEAWQLANWYYQPDKRQYIIYGLGLGYHVEALADMDESIQIQVFEQDIEVIYYFLKSRKQDKLLDNSNIKIVFDPELKQFSHSLTENAVVILHHPSLRHIKQNTIRERMEYMFIRDSGIRNQHNLMVSNFRENELNCKHNVDELRDEFAGKKAVIVAAGPSLDKNIELLKQKPEDCLIISTGTVFHKLIQAEIDVDYVIVSDAQPTIFSQFCQDLEKRIPILVLSTASKCVASQYAGEKYIIYQKDYDLSENMAKEKDRSVYQTGGSVSTTALDVCLKLGCKSVAYIGLDLAYTDKKGHADGTTGVEKIDTSDMRIVPGYEIIKTDNRYEINNIDVPSSHLFDMYRQWIEDRVTRTTIPVFDATEGGSVVNGLEITTLQDYLETL